VSHLGGILHSPCYIVPRFRTVSAPASHRFLFFVSGPLYLFDGRRSSRVSCKLTVPCICLKFGSALLGGAGILCSLRPGSLGRLSSGAPHAGCKYISRGLHFSVCSAPLSAITCTARPLFVFGPPVRDAFVLGVMGCGLGISRFFALRA